MSARDFEAETFGPVQITIPAKELELQLRTLRAAVEFQSKILPIAVESLRASEMPETAGMLETMRARNCDALQLAIDGLTKYMPATERA